MRDDDALAEFVRDRGAALLKHATLLVGSRRGAEDLVQDALVKVFATRRGRVRDLDSLEAYVRRTVLTTFLDSYRRHRRWVKVRHLFADPDIGPPDDDVAGAVDVTAALRTLSPRERACVVLRFYDDLTVPQIADELGLAQGTVKRYLSDATHALAATLGPGVRPEETEVVS
ncbi:sigma-70 family RNA polymerase sigma factor [Pseudactinotalea sp.]|uniref:sigma-70 family RNA polymerase sigma factor n=1 Tax=Pseudactinotalea sp. TaxID=1926260 RepID=UPI003B3B418D